MQTKEYAEWSVCNVDISDMPGVTFADGATMEGGLVQCLGKMAPEGWTLVNESVTRSPFVAYAILERPVTAAETTARAGRDWTMVRLDTAAIELPGGCLVREYVRDSGNDDYCGTPDTVSVALAWCPGVTLADFGVQNSAREEEL